MTMTFDPEKARELAADLDEYAPACVRAARHLRAACDEVEALLNVARSCPSCGFVYSHRSLLPLETAEKERDEARAQLARVEAERDAMRAVVEAAKELAAACGYSGMTVAERELFQAIDALTATTRGDK